MGQNDVFGDGQAQAGATRLPRSGLVNTVETLKKPGQVFGRNSRSKVLHVKFDSSLGRARAQNDPVAGSCILQCVIEQVSKDLVYGFPIGIHCSVGTILDDQFDILRPSDFSIRSISVRSRSTATAPPPGIGAALTSKACPGTIDAARAVRTLFCSAASRIAVTKSGSRTVSIKGAFKRERWTRRFIP